MDEKLKIDKEELIDYDFIEIGTSNFETLIQTCKDTDVGISVEPIKYYLDMLPNKPNVKKINKAISNRSGSIQIFYLPEHLIPILGVPIYLKGCNSVDDYHYQHRLCNVTEHVCKEWVDVIPISKLLKDNNVRKVHFLKIDTEGHDCIIMSDLYNYLLEKNNEKNYYPSKIQFESNILTSKELVDHTINLFQSIGYIVEYRDLDTMLVLSS